MEEIECFQNFFINCNSLEEAKVRHKKLSLIFHPDIPGGDNTSMMIINLQFDRFTKGEGIGQNRIRTAWDVAHKLVATVESIIDEFNASHKAVAKIMKNEKMPKVLVEGNCYAFKERLKELGFKYDSKFKRWMKEIG